jgi:uncharacterized protein YndB with AHSA1/START domain
MPDAHRQLVVTGLMEAKAEMLIRRPAAEVFEAFIDPAITSKFWFTHGSGKLEAGSRVRWEWEMFGVTTDVQVIAVEPYTRIAVKWGDEGEATNVEWTFTSRGDVATFVSIKNSGFRGNGDELIGQVVGSTEGFTLVLAGLKAWLEHGLALNLVADRFPPTPARAHNPEGQHG